MPVAREVVHIDLTRRPRLGRQDVGRLSDLVGIEVESALPAPVGDGPSATVGGLRRAGRSSSGRFKNFPGVSAFSPGAELVLDVPVIRDLEQVADLEPLERADHPFRLKLFCTS